MLNKKISMNKKNKDIYQYFGDATYRCVPSTFKLYKLYIISCFNLILKRTRIFAQALIPKETFITDNEMFKILKNNLDLILNCLIWILIKLIVRH